MAKILADLNLDCETVCAGLLHDVLEESDYKPENLEEFGPNIALLVGAVPSSPRHTAVARAMGFHKMILAAKISIGFD